MRPSRLSYVALALCTIIPAMASHLLAREIEGGNRTYGPLPVESYFRKNTAANLLHGHIALMSLSWMCAFPVYLVFDIAKSNLAYLAQIFLLGLNAIGLIFGLAYNSKTPALYPGNSHHNLGWILTGIAIFQFGLGILRSFARSRSGKNTSDVNHEQQPFIPISEARANFHDSLCHGDVEAASPRSSICCGTSSNGTDCETLYDITLPRRRTSIGRRYSQPMTWTRRWANVVDSDRLVPTLNLIFSISNVALITLAFVAICAGIVTVADIFHEKHIFNGLAHFIKGGVFFIYGLITFCRWMGCFAHLGWAWNLKPTTDFRNWKNSITMEGVECFLILVYGVSNVFLEHLSAWGGEWTAQDFEHVAISVLFIGGGLCGMMVETKAFRSVPTTNNSQSHESKSTLQPGYSLNPIPAMIILILGMILGGHRQKSVEATMMHKWVGKFLASAAAARCITYLLIYISPPTSITPSRLPSELVTSFCLMSGGFMLMASNKDTVDAMIKSGLNAMLVATVDMGCVAAVMAWGMGLFILRGWAGKREERYLKRMGKEIE